VAKPSPLPAVTLPEPSTLNTLDAAGEQEFEPVLLQLTVA
jgi:hypothetical protein